jgi:hypothetical protein
MAWSLGSQHVAEHGGVTDFLLGHELDQKAVFRAQPCGLKVLFRKHGESMMEQVQLNVLLIDSECLNNVRLCWIFHIKSEYIPTTDSQSHS